MEARLLPDAAALAAGKLRRQAIAVLLELDADADAGTRRQEQAQRRSDVRVHPCPQEGRATLPPT